MATVRRLYMYLVCLISLQSVIGALIGLFGGLIRWAVRADTTLDALSLTFQLAVIIVGAPIFLGHWLWAASLARKDPVELNSLSRRFYLYLTKGVLVGVMALAVFAGVSSFVSLVLPGLSDSTLPASELIAGLLGAAVNFGLAGVLWFYHDRLTADGAVAHSPTLKIVVPVSAPGIQWAAVSQAADLELEIVQAVKQALSRPRVSARRDQPAAEIHGS